MNKFLRQGFKYLDKFIFWIDIEETAKKGSFYVVVGVIFFLFGIVAGPFILAAIIGGPATW